MLIGILNYATSFMLAFAAACWNRGSLANALIISALLLLSLFNLILGAIHYPGLLVLPPKL